MRSALALSALLIGVILLANGGHCEDDPPTPEGGSSSSGTGVRAWIRKMINGLTTTTTTTPPPNIFNRAQNFYEQQKKNVKIILDPKKAIQDRLLQSVGLGGSSSSSSG